MEADADLGLALQTASGEPQAWMVRKVHEGPGEPAGVRQVHAGGQAMTPSDIIRHVAIARGLSYSMLRSPNRTKHVSRARHEAMWLVWKLIGMSTPSIAREVGRRDHTTSIYGIRKIQAAVNILPEYGDQLLQMVSGAVTEKIENRFWAKVSRSDGCWEWTGYRDRNGYGRFNAGRIPELAHRVSWRLTNEEAGDMCVLHRCDNPPCT